MNWVQPAAVHFRHLMRFVNGNTTTLTGGCCDVIVASFPHSERVRDYVCVCVVSEHVAVVVFVRRVLIVLDIRLFGNTPPDFCHLFKSS